jgi:LysR family transcriptional regulator, nod-box dependent transcriptional activator
MALQLHQFDLNLLRSLDVLLNEKSVTRAADKLSVTQQAMSGSLKRLREHFGDDLLLRIGPRLELTPLGSALLSPVREVLLQVGLALETTPSFDPAKVRRRFRIAMSDYAALIIGPSLIRRVLESAPGITCDLLPLDHMAFLGLDAGDIDLCLLPKSWRVQLAQTDEFIRTVPLYDDEFVCVVDATVHAFDEMTLERYLTLPHAALRLTSGHRTSVDDGWLRHGVSPRVVATSTAFASLVFMIAGTPMVATVQRRLAQRLSKVFPIRILSSPVDLGPLNLALSWHARCDADLAHRYLRELFVSAAREMDTEAVA